MSSKIFYINHQESKPDNKVLENNGWDDDELHSLKELTFQLYFDEVLKYNHSCKIVDGAACNCGHQFNFYDMLLTALKKHQYHDRDGIKEMLSRTPKMRFTTTKEVLCPKCGTEQTVTANYNYPNNMD